MTAAMRAVAHDITPKASSISARLAEHPRKYEESTASPSPVLLVAAPIRRVDGKVVTAVSIAGPMYRFTPKQPRSIRAELLPQLAGTAFRCQTAGITFGAEGGKGPCGQS